MMEIGNARDYALWFRAIVHIYAKQSALFSFFSTQHGLNFANAPTPDTLEIAMK